MPDKPFSILETHPHLKEFLEFLDHLNNESERGQVLVSASMIDDLLLQIIKAFLIEDSSAEKLLSGFNAPIGTFSARTEGAHALGLISDSEYQDATTIRKIRNEFAHSISASFETPIIRERCASLHFRARDYDEISVPSRGQFSTAATALILNLTNRPYYVGRKRLKFEDWLF